MRDNFIVLSSKGNKIHDTCITRKRRDNFLTLLSKGNERQIHDTFISGREEKTREMRDEFKGYKRQIHDTSIEEK